MLNSLLVHSEVTSNLLIKHVVDMAAIASVPVLLLPNLKELLKENTGISSVAVGIQKTVPDNSKLHIIAEKVKEIHKRYPVPESYINYYRMQTEKSDNEELIQTYENLKNKNNQTLQTNSNSCQISETKQELMVVSGEDSVGPAKTTDVGDVYLFRQNKTQRIFVPDKSEPIKNSMNLNNSLDFLSLDIAGKNTNNSKKTYKSLIVKRLKGNKDRDKRKREIMKKQKKKHFE